jgi:hypothetical protein
VVAVAAGGGGQTGTDRVKVDPVNFMGSMGGAGGAGGGGMDSGFRLRPGLDKAGTVGALTTTGSKGGNGNGTAICRPDKRCEVTHKGTHLQAEYCGPVSHRRGFLFRKNPRPRAKIGRTW